MSNAPDEMTMPARRGSLLASGSYPVGTPLNHFFAWNERAWRRDPRYVIAQRLYRLATAVGDNASAARIALRAATVTRSQVLGADRATWFADGAFPAMQQAVEALMRSVGSGEIGDHAAVFGAFECLADEMDLDRLARRWHRHRTVVRPPSQRQILVVRLSAIGDFIQALGPVTAIRRHHRRDRITLLTTASLAEFAAHLGLFDEIMIDRRPGHFDVAGWLALRRELRRRRFDRVYDLQTSQRSAAYFRLFRPGPVPEWSGRALGCSHPHANLGRDRQHTIDKQAEQLLMAGIYPTPLPALPALAGELPDRLRGGRPFVLIVPGSSERHLAKRWPARRYGALAAALDRRGYASVVIGAGAERSLAATIRERCPAAIDLVGATDLAAVAALAQRATLAVGNDTGVIHIAAAAGCPIVVLFSHASDPDWCAPRGGLVRILSASNLDDLDLDQVLAAASETIAESRRGIAGAACSEFDAPVAAGGGLC